MPSRSKMRRKGYRHIPRLQLIAIVFRFENGRPVPARYHTQEIPRVLRRFLEFVQLQFPTARYINFYKQKRFYYRHYLIDRNIVNCPQAIKKQRQPARFKDLRDPVLRIVQEYSLY